MNYAVGLAIYIAGCIFIFLPGLFFIIGNPSSGTSYFSVLPALVLCAALPWAVQSILYNFAHKTPLRPKQFQAASLAKDRFGMGLICIGNFFLLAFVALALYLRLSGQNGSLSGVLLPLVWLAYLIGILLVESSKRKWRKKNTIELPGGKRPLVILAVIALILLTPSIVNLPNTLSTVKLKPEQLEQMQTSFMAADSLRTAMVAQEQETGNFPCNSKELNYPPAPFDASGLLKKVEITDCGEIMLTFTEDHGLNGGRIIQKAYAVNNPKYKYFWRCVSPTFRNIGHSSVCIHDPKAEPGTGYVIGF